MYVKNNAKNAAQQGVPNPNNIYIILLHVFTENT